MYRHSADKRDTTRRPGDDSPITAQQRSEHAPRDQQSQRDKVYQVTVGEFMQADLEHNKDQKRNVKQPLLGSQIAPQPAGVAQNEQPTQDKCTGSVVTVRRMAAILGQNAT